MARRQGDKRLRRLVKNESAADEQRDGALLDQAGESRFKLAFAASAQDKNLPPERARSCPHLAEFRFAFGLFGFTSISNDGGFRHQLVQELQSLRCQFDG